jgi:hypothetical protein
MENVTLNKLYPTSAICCLQAKKIADFCLAQDA